MIILLIYLASLFGGGAVESLVIDITKPVKTVVQDQARVKQILAINAEMLKAEAALQKEFKAAKKTLAELNGNRMTSEAEIVAVFAAFDLKRAEARAKIVENRSKMMALMSAEEWRNVYATATK